MTQLQSSGFLPIGEATLEYRVAGDPAVPPGIVMLHEGLGSAALWGDFPDKLAAATGATVFAYSRAGYGASSPVRLPRPLSYMHDEAKDTLPALLDAIGFRRGLLLGHSDGASIAAIYAGSTEDFRVRGLVLIAPHFFTEELASIRVPVQVVQGEADQYGTIRQVEVAQQECYCPVEVAMIAGAGHSPQRERPEVTLDAVAGFANQVLRLHHEADPA